MPSPGPPAVGWSLGEKVVPAASDACAESAAACSLAVGACAAP